MVGSPGLELSAGSGDSRKLSTGAPITVDGEGMNLVQFRTDSGMTFVVLMVCIAVLLALASVVQPTLNGAGPERETLASVEHIAALVAVGGAPAIPDGRSWLHGPGPLPAGLAPQASWPLRRWLGSRRGRSFEERIPVDGWGRAIAVIPMTMDAGCAALVVSSGPDGVIQSSTDSGVVGDDVGWVVRGRRSG